MSITSSARLISLYPFSNNMRANSAHDEPNRTWFPSLDLRLHVAFADDVARGIPADTAGDIECIARFDGLSVIEDFLEVALVVDLVGFGHRCFFIVESVRFARPLFAVRSVDYFSTLRRR